MKLITWILLSFSLLSISEISFSENNSTPSPISAYRLNVSDASTARKVAISFHHAVIEINYKDKFLILDLTKKEVEQLAGFGLKAQPAPLWQARIDEFQDRLKSIAASKETRAGIPGFDCYPTVEETLSQAEQLATQHPTLAQWIDIGDSWNKTNGMGGYDLMVLKITNQAILEEKPKLFIHSAMHAREYTTAALTLDFAKLLLEEYQGNADYQWVVDHHEVHILFQMNPDGRKIAETGVYHRKNTNQNHCPGVDVGVDLNRNFAFFWNTTVNGSSGEECDSTYRGESAESEPETQAVSNYIRSLYPDVRGENDDDASPEDTPGLHLDIHSYSELVLWPWGHTDSPSPNDDAFVELGNKLAWFNDYAPQQSIGLYATDGTSDDVSYGELGIAAFTFELGTTFFQQCSVYETAVKPDNLPALFYSAKVAAAPFQLGFGPEIIETKINGANGEVSVSQGSIVRLEATASAERTKRTRSDRRISKIEFTIDTPIWQAGATPVELTENDGDLDSAVESMTVAIDTSGFSLGRHKIYFRGFNESGQAGVPTAVFIDIAENGAPTPAFSYSCEELSCSFDASDSLDSDGTIASYRWNFNDGTESSGITTTHNFSEPGNQRVTLTVTDNSGNEAVINQQFEVIVKLPPDADFFARCDELLCQFDSSPSTDADGDLVGYAWDFGDGNSATGRFPVHSFAEAGTYSVTLTITDNDSLEGSIAKSVRVTAPPAPETSSGGGGIGRVFLLIGLVITALRCLKRSYM